MDTVLVPKEVYDLFPLDGTWYHPSSSQSTPPRSPRGILLLDVNYFVV